MKWSQAKTILIIFFIAVDLFLLYYLTSDDRSLRENLETVSQNTVEVLKNNGIAVDAELIASLGAAENMKTAYVENIVASYEDFAELALGESAKKTAEAVFENENGKISFSGDSFRITAGERHCDIVPKTKSEAEKAARELLEGLGVEIKNAAISAGEENGGFTVSVNGELNGCEMFGTGIEIRFGDKGITNVDGCWYNSREGNTQSVKLRSLPGVLIEYMNSVKNPPKGFEITGISLGYAAPDANTHHESLVLTPVWQITDNSGKNTYIDAREH